MSLLKSSRPPALISQDAKAVTYLFRFDTVHGEQSLLNLFDGRKQLVLYHMMLAAEDDSHSIAHAFCMDQGSPYLHSRDTLSVAVSPAPLQAIDEHATRLGWTIPNDR